MGKANWCSVHNCDFTGFTTMYCGKCEMEKEEIKFIAPSSPSLIADGYKDSFGPFSMPKHLLVPNPIFNSPILGHAWPLVGKVMSIFASPLIKSNIYHVELDHNRYGTFTRCFATIDDLKTATRVISPGDTLEFDGTYREVYPPKGQDHCLVDVNNFNVTAALTRTVHIKQWGWPNCTISSIISGPVAHNTYPCRVCEYNVSMSAQVHVKVRFYSVGLVDGKTRNILLALGTKLNIEGAFDPTGQWIDAEDWELIP